MHADPTMAASLVFLLSAVLLHMPPDRAEAQWVHRPRFAHHAHIGGPRPSQICASQFTLANTACSLLPFRPPPLPFIGHHHRRRNHHHGHSHWLDLYHQQQQTPPEQNGDEEEQRRRRRHHGRHHHHHRRTESTAESECCRWVTEVDDGCVCELLLNLPVFLARPVHHFTVVVDEGCNVTYACGPRFVEL